MERSDLHRTAPVVPAVAPHALRRCNSLSLDAPYGMFLFT